MQLSKDSDWGFEDLFHRTLVNRTVELEVDGL